jgi:hypothetical protein
MLYDLGTADTPILGWRLGGYDAEMIRRTTIAATRERRELGLLP